MLGELLEHSNIGIIPVRKSKRVVVHLADVIFCLSAPGHHADSGYDLSWVVEHPLFPGCWLFGIAKPRSKILAAIFEPLEESVSHLLLDLFQPVLNVT